MPIPTVTELNEGKEDLDDLESLVNGTGSVQTRLGGIKPSYSQLTSALTHGDIDAYDPTETVTLGTQWRSHSGIVYRPIPSALPISPTSPLETTPNTAKWLAVQLTFDKAQERYPNRQAFIDSTPDPLTTMVWIDSFYPYGSAASPYTTPKGGHFMWRTGATNTAPTVSTSPLPSASSNGTGTQAGYAWDASGAEWVILGDDISAYEVGAINNWGIFKESVSLPQDLLVGDQNFVVSAGGAPISEGGKRVSRGRVTIIPDASYSAGSPGGINYFGFLIAQEPRILVENVSFDGNGSGTEEAYNPAIVNVWFNPFIANSSSGNGGHRIMFRNIDVTDCAGHAIETAAVDMASAVGITASGHNGIGSTGGFGHVYAGITSYNTHDSHFFLNSADNTVLCGWSATLTSNGGGVDVAGGDNVVVSSGVSVDAKTAATWILKSPNTGVLANRVLVTGLISHNDSRDPTTFGSFLIGDYNNPTEEQGADYMVTGSLVSVTDSTGSGGSNFNTAVQTTEGCAKVTFSNNHLTGEISPTGADIYYDLGSEDSAYVNNIAQFGTEYATLLVNSKPQGRGLVWRNNVGSRVNPESPYKPTIMVDDDGYWRYSIIHKPDDLSAFDFVDLLYAAGNTRYLVELTASQSGSGGIIQKRIVLRGVQGGATTVHENTDVVSYDTPATVTVTTSDTNKTRISITPTNTESMLLTLRVYGANVSMTNILMWPSLV